MLGANLAKRDLPEITLRSLVTDFGCTSSFVFDFVALRARMFGIWADSFMIASLAIAFAAYLATILGASGLGRSVRTTSFVCAGIGLAFAVIEVSRQWYLGIVPL
jgi:hypothetical protein